MEATTPATTVVVMEATTPATTVVGIRPTTEREISQQVRQNFCGPGAVATNLTGQLDAVNLTANLTYFVDWTLQQTARFTV